MLKQAQEEADRIVALAQEQVSGLADDHEIVKAAYTQAEDVIAQAHRSAQEVKAEADSYVMEVLSGLEEELMRLLTTVRNGIRQVQEVNIPPEAEQQVVKADVDSNQ
jgi:vacuolar-type H+-ATPase subunit H